MLFLYYNDNWTRFLPVQLTLTFTDTFSWWYYLAVINHQMTPRWLLTQAALYIKSLHIFFNLAVEGEPAFRSFRTCVFLIEVLYNTYNAMYPYNVMYFEQIITTANCDRNSDPKPYGRTSCTYQSRLASFKSRGKRGSF